ncbi:MAG: PCRF domain-containing protein, partial [Alphaproteobacteria bacterium]|nr:PCRF domain-containing protein [Alphaproteobacteria bacterium]
MEAPDFWDTPDKAQTMMKEKTSISQGLDLINSLERDLEDNLALLEMAESESDQAETETAEAAIFDLQIRVQRQQLDSLLSGEADENDCFLEVHAGAGGTEAQDWVEMLLRMYCRWAESRGYKTEWIEESPGEEAGLKSATLRIKGEKAYGWLKTESGIHRLVRISPFDSNSRRHTSFASVGIYPVIDDR